MANDKGITIKMRTWVVLLLIVAVAGFATYKIVRYSKDVAALEKTLRQKEDNIKTFQIVVDGLNEKVTENKLLLIDSQRALKKSEQYAERLKELNIKKVYTIGSLELQIAAMKDSLQLYKSNKPPVINDTPIDVVEVNDKPMIELPASFGWETDEAVSWGVITEDGNGESGFEIKELPINIVLGSRGFFKPVYVSSVSTTNSLVSIEAQQFVVTDQTKKIPAIAIAGSAGIVAGIITTLLLTR